jgi:fructoselysine-6-P-deglycase FrlB-like protein
MWGGRNAYDGATAQARDFEDLGHRLLDTFNGRLRTKRRGWKQEANHFTIAANFSWGAAQRRPVPP